MGDDVAVNAAQTISLIMVGDDGEDASVAGSSEGSTRLDEGFCSSSGSATWPSSLLIYDWDDTLFPTTWVQKNDLVSFHSVTTMDQFAHLGRLAQCVHENLSLSKRLGKVIIVTNADAGWVELSCSRFMPSLRWLLEESD